MSNLWVNRYAEHVPSLSHSCTVYAECRLYVGYGILCNIMAQHKDAFTVEHAAQSLLALVAARVQADDVNTLVARGAVWADRRGVLDAAWMPPVGAQIEIHFPPSGQYDTVALTTGDIVWEDDVLLAINKRPGWHTNYNPWDM